jgi:hypothetical protein
VPRFRLSPEQLLNIQVRAFANSVPDSVLVGKKENIVKLSQNEIEAAKLAVWYVLKRAWGLSSAIQVASGSFSGCNKSNVKRAVGDVFPDNYFKSLERSKSYSLFRNHKHGEDDEDNEDDNKGERNHEV